MVRVPKSQVFGGMKAVEKRTERRVTDLERTDGTQYASTWEKIKAFQAGLSQQVADEISKTSYTKTQIDTKRWPFSQIDGVAQPAQGGTGTTNAHNNDLASSNRRALWVSEAGVQGFALSAFSKKANPQPADIPVELFLGMETQRFQYRSADKELVGWDFGFFAEDFAALGLEEWVYRSATGELEGIAYERLQFVYHEALRRAFKQLHNLRTEKDELLELVTELAERVTALEPKE